MRFLAGLLMAASLAGCEATVTREASPGFRPMSPEGQKDVSSGTPVERFFPLRDGEVYTYDVGPTVLMVRVHRTDALHGETQLPTGQLRYTYGPEGLEVQSATSRGFVLKTPLAAGTTWRNPNGATVRIASLNAEVDTPAGHFSGCLEVSEERGGDRPSATLSTFCPDVGLVKLDTRGEGSAILKTHGQPMLMKPDGLDRSGGPAR